MEDILARIDLTADIFAFIVFGALGGLLVFGAINYVLAQLLRAKLFAQKSAEVAYRKVASRFRSAA